MSSLVKGDFYLFTAETRGVLLLSVIDYLLGICGNTILIFLWWKNRKQDTDRFSILIMAVDLLGIFNVVTEILVLSLDGFGDDRLGPGYNYCIALGIGNIATCLTNLQCISLYTYQRYRIIMKKKPLHLGLCFAILAGYFIFALFVAAFPLFFGTPYQYSPAGTYCVVDWADKSAPNLLPIVVGAIGVSGCLVSIVYMYSEIFKHLRKGTALAGGNMSGTASSITTVKTVRLTIGAGQGGSSKSSDPAAKEKAMVKRVIFIVSACFFCYSPYFFGAIFEEFSGMHVNKYYDAFSADLAVANGLLDFIVFITTNAAYGRMFWGLFGIKKSNK